MNHREDDWEIVYEESPSSSTLALSEQNQKPATIWQKIEAGIVRHSYVIDVVEDMWRNFFPRWRIKRVLFRDNWSAYSAYKWEVQTRTFLMFWKTIDVCETHEEAYQRVCFHAYSNQLSQKEYYK